MHAIFCFDFWWRLDKIGGQTNVLIRTHTEQTKREEGNQETRMTEVEAKKEANESTKVVESH